MNPELHVYTFLYTWTRLDIELVRLEIEKEKD